MAYYQHAVYRAKDGNELVVASSGTVTVESGGKLDLESGSTMTIASGAALSLAATLTVASGGKITLATGGGIKWPVQTVATSTTTITAEGISLVTGTTDGPTYLIANPRVGVRKWLTLQGASSGDDTDAVSAVVAATTNVSFDTTGQNVLTLATTSLRSVTLIGLTTTRYAVVGTKYAAEAGLSNAVT